MRKIIAAINMTLDGYCDHTYGIADDELHDHYTDLINSAGVLLYGRITYQLMEYWRTVLEEPTGNKATDDFAVMIDRIPKIVFSHTLKSIDWGSAKLATRELKEEVLSLKEEQGKPVFIGSPGLIAALTQLNLIDEFQLCIHPVIAGKGLPLFRNISDLKWLKLVSIKTMGSGAMVVCYERAGTV